MGGARDPLSVPARPNGARYRSGGNTRLNRALISPLIPVAQSREIAESRPSHERATGASPGSLEENRDGAAGQRERINRAGLEARGSTRLMALHSDHSIAQRACACIRVTLSYTQKTLSLEP